MGFQRTTFNVPKMDCPSEERIIRMALDGVSSVKELVFDLSAKQLKVIHSGSEAEILSKLVPLNYGATVNETKALTESEISASAAGRADSTSESKVLKILLAINASMFFIEMGLGWLAQSAGLIADSLDMFADALVYGIGLYAVGRTRALKQRAARWSGYFQLLLAVGAFVEVARRFIYGTSPEGGLMIGIAVLALVANVICMALLAKHRTGEVHMRASWIFSTNDVIANLGVIVAGALVTSLNSPLPDLVIGTIIGAVVLSGAARILRVAGAV